MSERIIKIADNFMLDVQDHIITRGLGMLGIRGGGKSYAAGKVCEQLCKVKQPYLVIDLMGEYYTLKERFPVVVISQGSEDYADIKDIKPEMAPAIAHVVLESGQSTILDLKAGTMLEKFKFLAEFLPALYNAAKDVRRPCILVMDEAHRITPERSLVRLRELKEFQDKVMYWTYEIGNTGRQYGLGFIAIARRSAEVAKSTLNNCELILQFKAKGIDLDNILTKDFSREKRDDARRRVRMFKPGDALVRGLAEPVFIHVTARECSHGGGTPLTKPAEVPGMSKFSSMLKKALAQVQVPPEKRVPREVMEELKTKTRQLSLLQRETSTAKEEIVRLTKERDANVAKVQALEQEVRRLKEIPPEELERLTLEAAAEHKRAVTAEERVRDLEVQLSEASQLEEQLEVYRIGARDLFDSLVDYSRVLSVDLVPKDIQQITQERDELREKLEVYQREEALKEELMGQTLRDGDVKSWVSDATRILRDLSRRGQAGQAVLKFSLRMDPETAFLPEEIQTGYTAATNLNYLNILASKGLLWEARKRDRKAFRNRLRQWVAENIRRIRPSAPDVAIDKIADELKRTVIR